jgi:hypothetical protein
MLQLLFHCLLGAICGLRFRVQILIPLITFTCIEVAILEHAGTWWTFFGLEILLITGVEVGYLIGSAVAAFRSPSANTKLRHLSRYRHDELSRTNQSDNQPAFTGPFVRLSNDGFACRGPVSGPRR